VYTGTAGYADVDAEIPYTPDTICRVMSQSKPVTAVATLILVDDGKLRLSDTLQSFNSKFKDMRVVQQMQSDETIVTEPIRVRAC
jgi:CubicO group peptidase (beta-lactamase class C family)